MIEEELDDRALKDRWNQSKIPIIIRRPTKGERHRLRLPFAQGNGKWLNDACGNRLKFIADGQYWEIPQTRFNDFVESALDRYGAVYIIQPYNEQEKCAPACQNARGYECQCSCMGAHHGAGNDGSWFEVSDTFATRWGPRTLACRLLTRRRTNP